MAGTCVVPYFERRQVVAMIKPRAGAGHGATAHESTAHVRIESRTLHIEQRAGTRRREPFAVGSHRTHVDQHVQGRQPLPCAWPPKHLARWFRAVLQGPSRIQGKWAFRCEC